jgi:hypothetical protein
LVPLVDTARESLPLFLHCHLIYSSSDTHPSSFALIDGRSRFLAHTSYHRIAQCRTLLLESSEIRE